MAAQNQNRYDYKEFLRKFSVLKEEMKVDMDTFDYIFYNYGMNLYGNMPPISYTHLDVYKRQSLFYAWRSDSVNRGCPVFRYPCIYGKREGVKN